MAAGPKSNAAILAEALNLIRKGIPCFPCHASKRPSTPQGYKNATTDPAVLLDLWRRHPGPLIGVPTGEVSGLDVLDLDPRHGGTIWYAQHRSGMPPTRVHRTRSGGLHIFFRHSPGSRC